MTDISLPRVPDYRKRGRSGEHEIASLLCLFSNIMPPDYDFGFDYYCELLENDCPSGKFFWVQAKTTKQFGESWSEYIDKKTIALWLSQVFPVFVLVFEQASEKCYWLSVQEKRTEWSKKLSDENESISITVQREHEIKRNYENKDFISKVNNDLILTNAIHGIPHMIGQGYVRTIPVLSLSEAAQSNLRYKVRLGLNYLINDMIIRKDFQGAYDLLKILAVFDLSHYDHFLTLARVCRKLGKSGEARANYSIAIGLCKDDHNWNKLKKPEDASIEEIIESIEKELLRFREPI
jgi:hypothetical protein